MAKKRFKAKREDEPNFYITLPLAKASPADKRASKKYMSKHSRERFKEMYTPSERRRIRKGVRPWVKKRKKRRVSTSAIRG